ncbi:origin recognition complex subunit 1-like [Sinocyclocheilus rhinocerous]|uniref:origin recognition complex subunit 1-like n=1 Tax=Sinocyclocheilus rhinocerous TaxID=307959 RepID=UPI0007B8424A|nr:PREDICTED: origin recognition complex subunit 1-like [Sinocyclocheilus rhinocerous]
MSRYITRLRMRRAYKWNGRPVSKDRKLKRQYYESMSISVEGKTEDVTVSLGQYILIEGDDDDNPFVAQLLKLYTDDSGKKKTAVVQWFVRMCEVPQNKRKLLGRDPHPQEIFFYQDRSCDNEVDGETILGAVQIEYVPVEDPFPKGKSKGILFVKLLWDTKSFRALNPELMQPPQSSKSPPPSSHGTQTRALPTPDLSVMKRAMSGILTRGSMSTGKMSSSEAESLHSASKLSAAKALSAKRRSRAVSGPHVRKKLDLCSPSKNMTRDDVLGEILDEHTEKTLTSKLNTSPTGRISISIRLTRLNLNEEECVSPLSSHSPDKPRLTAYDKDDATSVFLGVQPIGDDDPEPLISTGRTPRKREATPRSAGLRGLKARTPSRRKDALREPALAALAEEEHEYSPVQTAATPCSKRKSAQLESSRIRKQLNLLGNTVDLQSDGEDGDDDDCFVPAKIDLQSSSDEEEEAKIDSEDELIVKKRRGSGTSRSTEKTRVSARTPRKTPSKKTAPATPRTPRHATPSIPSRSAPAKKPGNVLEEARLQETTVLLVDELDLLWTRKQNVMYNLFDWPTRRNARLVVLTIANTMDLPERIMINRVASRLGLTRMSFQPYTFKQLQQIITSRLNRVKAFEEDALQLVSRKVAALSGDARRCLDICRRATEICEHSGSQKNSSGLVGMSHVMEALDEMFSSSYIAAIRCASVQEQLFLRAVIAEFRRLGLEEATFQQVFVQHQALCRVEGLQPVNVSEGLTVCQRLGSCRLLLLEGSRLDLFLRIRLNVSQDDVLFALKAD